MSKILYLTFESLEKDPILTTQVLSLLKKLKSKHHFQLLTIDSEEFIQSHNSNLQNVFIKKGSFLISLFRLVKWTLLNSKKYDIIHVRSYLPMFSVLLPRILYSIPIIFDMRGVMPYEFRLRSRVANNLLSRLLYYTAYLLFFAFEFLFINVASTVVVVSAPFSAYVKRKLLFSIPLLTIPTFTVSKPLTTPGSNIDLYPVFLDVNAPIFVYSGSLDVWQQFPNTIRLFKCILNIVPEAKLLIITRQQQLANQLLIDSIPQNTFRVLTLLPDQVASALELGDFGILLRDQDIVNAVSAPIKFAEYLSSGLKIIISSGIGDASGQVDELDLGFVIPNLNPDAFNTFANSHLNELRQKSPPHISHSAKKLLDTNYSLEQAADKYNILYNQLLRVN